MRDTFILLTVTLSVRCESAPQVTGLPVVNQVTHGPRKEAEVPEEVVEEPRLAVFSATV